MTHRFEPTRCVTSRLTSPCDPTALAREPLMPPPAVIAGRTAETATLRQRRQIRDEAGAAASASASSRAVGSPIDRFPAAAGCGARC